VVDAILRGRLYRRAGRAAVTEAEARSLLRGGDQSDGLEAWIAGQRWAADLNGWRVGPAHTSLDIEGLALSSTPSGQRR